MTTAWKLSKSNETDNTLPTQVLVHGSVKRLDESPFEVIERKGIGHPDTVADGIAESISLAYSEFCLKQFGMVLHHNIDKVMVTGGLAEVDWGVGRVRQPTRILLNGRMSNRFGDKTIDLEELQTRACRLHLSRVLPRLEFPKHVKILSHTTSYSRSPYWFSPRDASDLPDVKFPYANDTSAVMGYWPLSRTERLVLGVEGFFYEGYSPRFSFLGQDIKVLAVRTGRSVHLTVCLPFLSNEVDSYEDYQEKLGRIRDELGGAVEDICQNQLDVTLTLNSEDQLVKDRHSSKGYYLVVTGSALDYGEEGVVGRGNRSRGLISCMRPATTEAVCGKNPVYHVGKVCTYIAEEMAKQIALDYDCEAQVLITTRNGDPLLDPHMVSVQLSENIDSKDVERTLRTMLVERQWTTEILHKKPFLPRPGWQGTYEA